MPLSRTFLPDATRKAMIAGLPRFLRPGEPHPEKLVNAPPERFFGVEAFTLGLKDVLGPGVSQARREGWRCLMEAPKFPAVAAVVSEPGARARPRMVSLMRGPQIGRVLRGALQIESMPEVKDKNYWLQMLSVPGILVETFWLTSKGDDVDLVIPFYSVSKELKVKRVYTIDQFMSIARPLARKFRAFQD